jgi:hypothetical protein
MVKNVSGHSGTTSYNFKLGKGQDGYVRVIANLKSANPEFRFNSSNWKWEVFDGYTTSFPITQNIINITFDAQGYYYEASNIDVNTALSDFTIEKIIILREVAGTSNYTDIQIYKNNSPIFTIPPRILYSTGNQYKVEVFPNINKIYKNDRLHMNILAVEKGKPQDLRVIIKGV